MILLHRHATHEKQSLINFTLPQRSKNIWLSIATVPFLNIKHAVCGRDIKQHDRPAGKSRFSCGSSFEGIYVGGFETAKLT